MRVVQPAGSFRSVIDVDEPPLVLAFFGGKPGFFVDVGANDPVAESQTWHLEQNGWTGILVEPQPSLTEQLASARRARVFAVAASSRENAGKTLPLFLSGGGSALDRGAMQPGAATQLETVDVPIRTLDDMLEEANAPMPVDFLSIDVEGHEVEALSGLDFARWQPRLVLLEDHVSDLSKHHFMTSRGYKLVRRTKLNGWYVPADAAVDFGLGERWRLTRKYFLGLPFRMLRNFSRRLRQPAKDRRAEQAAAQNSSRN